MYSTMLAALLVAAAAGAATALPTRGMTPAMTLDSSVRCALSLCIRFCAAQIGSGCRSVCAAPALVTHAAQLRAPHAPLRR